MGRPWRRTMDGRGTLQMERRIIRGPGEADFGRVGCVRDVQALRYVRECQVIAIATDVADAKRHSIEVGDSAFGPENCVWDRTGRCLFDDGEDLACLRIKTRRRTKEAPGQADVARGDESAVLADIGPIEINVQPSTDVFNRKRRVEKDPAASPYVSDHTVATHRRALS